VRRERSVRGIGVGGGVEFGDILRDANDVVSEGCAEEDGEGDVGIARREQQHGGPRTARHHDGEREKQKKNNERMKKERRNFDALRKKKRINKRSLFDEKQKTHQQNKKKEKV
jgi:hypothetical protein